MSTSHPWESVLQAHKFDCVCKLHQCALGQRSIDREVINEALETIPASERRQATGKNEVYQ